MLEIFKTNQRGRLTRKGGVMETTWRTEVLLGRGADWRGIRKEEILGEKGLTRKVTIRKGVLLEEWFIREDAKIERRIT